MEHPAALSGAPRACHGQPGRPPRDLPPRGERQRSLLSGLSAAVSFLLLLCPLFGRCLASFCSTDPSASVLANELRCGTCLQRKAGWLIPQEVGGCTGHLRPRSHFRGQACIPQGRQTNGWASTENVATLESLRNPYE